MQTPLQIEKSGGRQFYLDVARVLAILSISLNHAVNRSYDNFTNQMQEFLEISLASTILKTVVTVFSRVGVPLFLMISGVLLLNKRIENGQEVKRFYKHNLLSLLITTEIWYFLMYWFILLLHPGNHTLETEGFGGAVLGLFKTMLFIDQTAFDSMWYMPMILCLYTTIPFAVIVKEKVPARYLCLLLRWSFCERCSCRWSTPFVRFKGRHSSPPSFGIRIFAPCTICTSLQAIGSAGKSCQKCAIGWSLRLPVCSSLSAVPCNSMLISSQKIIC